MSATDSLSLVGQEVHRHDPDRFLTALMAPAERREDLLALYAFNSEVARIPEMTREPLLARMRVQWWRDGINAIFETETPPQGHPVAAALAAAIHRHGLPRALFDSLLDTRERDADPAPIPDLDTLDVYVEGTGGDLSRLAALILGVRDDRALMAADLVGRAYALVGLLRATPFLARHNRLYLPEALLAEVGTDASVVFSGGADLGIQDAARHIADGARRTLAESRRHRAAVPRNAIAAYLPAVLAEGHLRRLKAVDHDLFHPRMALPKRRPLALMLAAWRGRY